MSSDGFENIPNNRPNTYWYVDRSILQKNEDYQDYDRMHVIKKKKIEIILAVILRTVTNYFDESNCQPRTKDFRKKIKTVQGQISFLNILNIFKIKKITITKNVWNKFFYEK